MAEINEKNILTDKIIQEEKENLIGKKLVDSSPRNSGIVRIEGLYYFKGKLEGVEVSNGKDKYVIMPTYTHYFSFVKEDRKD